MTGDDLPEPTREEWDVDAMWSRVRARTVGAPESGVVRRWQWRRMLATAASVVVVAGSGALIVRARLSHSEAPLAEGRYSTSRGQYATIKLADGSEVTLAPESRLTISANFSRGAREITLDGEAIFSVRHDASHPFRVIARGAIVQDVGTRFDLRAYAADSTITVAVVEGSVSLAASRADSAADQRQRLVLGAGDVGTLGRGAPARIVKSADAASFLGWASGTLAFADRPLPEVLRAIARWHDVDVRVTDANLAGRRVTASFARESVQETLDALAIALDARVERTGRTFTLRPR